MTKDKLQEDALVSIGNNTVCGVSATVGFGKTVLGLKYIKRNFKGKVLVVAPKKSIFDSWKNDAIDRGFIEQLEQITFCTYRSLSKSENSYELIILDECHSLKYSHKEVLDKHLSSNGKILGLSGTFPKVSYGEKGEMCEKYAPLVYTYETDQGVSDDVLNDYEIFVHMIPLSKEKDIEKKTKAGGKYYTSEIKEYNFWTKIIEESDKMIPKIQRMTCMKKGISKMRYAFNLLNQQDDKTIIFVNTKDQANRMCKHKVHSGLSKKENKENLDNFKSGDITKLATVDQLSEGVNIPNLKVGIICHAYSDHKKVNQKIGRLLRLDPNEKSTIHILCYKDTIDEFWVRNATENLNQSKIKYIDNGSNRT